MFLKRNLKRDEVYLHHKIYVKTSTSGVPKRISKREDVSYIKRYAQRLQEKLLRIKQNQDQEFRSRSKIDLKGVPSRTSIR